VSPKQIAPQVIGVIALVVIAGIGLVKLWKAPPELTVPPFVKHSYRLNLIDQQEAIPGKLIRASGDGQAPAEYRCTEQDAAVATVFISDSDPNDARLLVSIGESKDPEGHLYGAHSKQVGHIAFVILERGFSSKPASVSVQFEVRNEFTTIGKFELNTPIKFTKIAAPKRVLWPPSKAETEYREKLAIAETIDGIGGPFVKIVAKQTPTNFYQSTVLETAFCPSGGPNSVVSLNQRWAHPDAAKVKLDEFETLTTDVTLVYRNAEIQTVNGIRLLVLPTTQTVGEIDGSPQTIQSLPVSAFNPAHVKHPQGIITIRGSVPNAGPPSGISPSIRFVDMTPSVDEMGLSWIHLGVEAFAKADLLTGSTKTQHSGITIIPELKMRFKFSKSVTVGSRTFVLPVHYVKEDKKLFPSPQPQKPSIGIAGSGMPLLNRPSSAPLLNPNAGPKPK